MKNIEDKIPDITSLTTNTYLNAKINEVKGEISSITNLAATAAPIIVENKIPNTNDLVKKKQIMMQKYQKWKMNILLLLTMASSQVIHLM